MYQRNNLKQRQTCRTRVPTVTCPYNVLILFFSIKNFKTCKQDIASAWIKGLAEERHEFRYMHGTSHTMLSRFFKVKIDSNHTLIINTYTHVCKKWNFLIRMEVLRELYLHWFVSLVQNKWFVMENFSDAKDLFPPYTATISLNSIRQNPYSSGTRGINWIFVSSEDVIWLQQRCLGILLRKIVKGITLYGNMDPF